MGRGGFRSVAIVGDGPAGATLGTLLARAGVAVALFSRGRPGELIVGESTIPAVVPLLRELGVEEEVRSYAQYKPGASFAVDADWDFEIRFAEVCRRVPGYAYNVPRDRFDATLLHACARAGVRIVPGTARVERVNAGGDRVRLAGESRARAADALGTEPDFVVDASGRSRALARLLDLPTRAGARRDEAIFAHWDGVPIEREGQIHSDRLEHGWCWRIPLPGRVSLGIVVEGEVLRALGAGAEARYEAFLRADPHLRRLTAGARRLTPVARYTNYQLVTLRGVGDGWALVGDAFGFVDPVFSSGIFLAMQGARELARALRAGNGSALRRYERGQRRHIAAWQRASDYFYDGRFFALFRMGESARGTRLGRIVGPHISRHVPMVFTGESITGAYAPRMLDFMMRHRLDCDPHPLRIS